MTASGVLRRGRRLWERYLVRRQVWVWLLPVAVFFGVRREVDKTTKLLEALLGIAGLIVVARRPAKSLSLLVFLLPFSTLLLAFMLKSGVPAFVVRGLRFWKELIVAGLALSAIGNLRRRRLEEGRLHFDALDRVATAYVVLGLAYMLMPGILAGGTVGAHLSFYARELGWRGDVLYVLIFLVCRHLGLSGAEVERLFRRFAATAVGVSAVGVYESFFTRSWLKFVNTTLGVASYDLRILGNTAHPVITEVYGSASQTHFPRIASVLLNYLSCGFYLMIALIAVAGMVSLRRQPWWISASLPLIAVGLVLNQGRAPILGAAVGMVVLFASRIRRSIARRAGFAVVVGLLVIAALPVVVTSGLGHRLVSSHKSNVGHQNQTELGIQAMEHHPLGRGLATAAGGGQAAADKGVVDPSVFLVSEDQWLQIGTQLGFAGLAVYVLFQILLAVRLSPDRHRGPPPAGVELAVAVRAALIGLAVAGFFLQTFIDDQIDWPFFALCGAAVATVDHYRRQAAAEAAGSTGYGRVRLLSSPSGWN